MRSPDAAHCEWRMSLCVVVEVPAHVRFDRESAYHCAGCGREIRWIRCDIDQGKLQEVWLEEAGAKHGLLRIWERITGARERTGISEL